MPLPANGTLSLLGYSRPGDTVQSRPKQAMIVRMSTETFDALENHPQMEFEFGDNPGIHIGDTFFPIRTVNDNNTPHELYLHAPSAARKNPPLKLYANVTGRLAVERELGDGVLEKLHESTAHAASQRNGKTAILLDAPLDLPSHQTKKRKDPPLPPNMFRKSVRPSDQMRNNITSTTSVSTRVASPAPQRQPAKEPSPMLRKRMAHCLAVSERTVEQAIKLVGGSDCSSTTRQELMELFEDLAEVSTASKSASNKSPKSYRLKPESWLEVRPYEWPNITESERHNMARSARYALKDLGIPESDPAWNHVKFRNVSSTTPNVSTQGQSTPTSRPPAGAASSSSTQNPSKPEAKRGVTSKQAKDKMSKPKPDRNTEIMMKDESKRAASRTSQVNNKALEGASSSNGKPSISPAISRMSAADAAARKPGSGFKVTKSISKEGTNETNVESGRASTSNGKLPEARAMKEKAPVATTSDASRRPPPSPIPKERKPIAPVPQKSNAKKVRDDGVGASDLDRRKDPDWGRERERDRGDRDMARAKQRQKEGVAERERPRDLARSRDKEEGEHSDDNPPVLKRKKPTRDPDGEYEDGRTMGQKRRRTEEHSSTMLQSESRSSTSHDISPSQRKTDVGERPRIKKEENVSQLPSVPKIKKESQNQKPSLQPPPPRKMSPKNSSSSSHQPNVLKNTKNSRASVTSNGTPKPRRRSPKYTSSEDEGENVRTSRRDAPSTSLPTPPTTTRPHPPNLTVPAPQPLQTSSHSHNIARPNRPSSTDHATLRARYNTTYIEYLATFQKLLVEKSKIDALLEHDVAKNGGGGSAGSVTDSDGDVELLDSEELVRLTAEHRKLHEELEGIQHAFTRSGKGGTGLD